MIGVPLFSPLERRTAWRGMSGNCPGGSLWDNGYSVFRCQVSRGANRDYCRALVCQNSATIDAWKGSLQ